MNFMNPGWIAQAPRSLILVILSASVISCSKSGTTTQPLPSDPDAAVVSFLSAVRAEDIDAMGRLWGTDDGPAADWMDGAELERRLTVMRIYLQHEEYAVVAGARDPTVRLRQGERLVSVRITRNGCTPVVPFTVTPYRDGWLVRDVKLEAAGNPARSCPVTP